MPIFEYKRLDDDSVFEVIQKPGEPALTKCPTTGSPVEKLISKSSFHLKGTGWYTTDYKDAKKPDTGEKAASSTESKPDTKSSETKASDSAASTPKESSSEAAPAKADKPAPKAVESKKSDT